MSDKIAEIRARHEFAGTHMRPAEFYWTIPGWIAHIDRAFLLAEVEDLRDETERLQSNNDNLTLECGEVRAEVERLTRQRDEARAEVERLRKEMLEVAEELENEEPRSHKNIAFGIRNAVEAKP